jgi:uncharacterized protein YabN with tetrapyrrole methylase and pyrophosphatase domain
MQEFDDLLKTFAVLLGPRGCPWDHKQTTKTIRRDLLEECHELLEAISLEDNTAICEELGDVLSVIVFLGKLAEKEGRFPLSAAVGGANEKLIRRHPHVFDRTTLANEEEFWRQWDRIKGAEKGKENRKSILDGIPTDLPALARAQKVHKKIGAHPPVETALHSDPEEALGEELWRLVLKAQALNLDAEQALRSFLSKKEREFRACELQRKSVP